MFVSVIANIVAHAIWQYYGIDGGHMISRGTQTVLPAGWVHLGFSIIETTLILAFAFIRRPRKPFTRIATVLALAFFLAAGVSGYVINHGFITTDVIVVWSGTALVAVYPWVRRRAFERSSRNRQAGRAWRQGVTTRTVFSSRSRVRSIRKSCDTPSVSYRIREQSKIPNNSNGPRGVTMFNFSRLPKRDRRPANLSTKRRRNAPRHHRGLGGPEPLESRDLLSISPLHVAPLTLPW